MQNFKKPISPLLYFILLSSLTNFTFLLVGVVFLTLFSVSLSSLVLQIIVFLLLWKGALVGFVSWFLHKKANNKDFLVKFIGIYLGRFFGILIGGFLGYRIFGTLNQPDSIGFIVGALAFYFAGRWIGSKVSILIGQQLDKVFAIPEMQIAEEFVGIKSASRLVLIGFILYSLIIPLLFVVIGLLMENFDFQGGYFPELLPISRIVVIVLSIFSIGIPWRLKDRLLEKYQTTTPSPESLVYWLGLVFSIIPVIYGFILYVAMGATIIELCFFAVGSSIVAIVWSMNNRVFIKQ